MGNYSQYELCKLTLKIEEYLKEGKRAINRFGLDKDSRPYVFKHLFQKALPPDELKIPEHFFNMCAQCVNAVDRGDKYNKSINPLPKVLQIVYLFSEYEDTKIEGFKEWLSSLDKGKYTPLIEMAIDEEIQSIANSVNIQNSISKILEEVQDMSAKLEGQGEALKRLEERNEFLNSIYKQIYKTAKSQDNDEILKIIEDWRKDFEPK